MKMLVVKTSSLGDILHCLPAVTEAKAVNPELEIHWMVEEQYAEIPTWHPAVDKVIPVAVRRWRKAPLRTLRSAEWRSLRKSLKDENYDLVIDAQGLLKSALLARQCDAPIVGYDRHSIREKVASFFYHRVCAVNKNQHAVERIRQLFAAALKYPLSAELPEYGIAFDDFSGPVAQAPYLVWIHGTAWTTKRWPQKNWLDLSQKAVDAGYRVLVPWGSSEEQLRAEDLAYQVKGVEALPRMTLTELAAVLTGAVAAVGVDTGLSHLTAAVATPAVSLYGPTDPRLTGTWGRKQRQLTVDFPCAPCLSRKCRVAKKDQQYAVCFKTIPVQLVWHQLSALLPARAEEIRPREQPPAKVGS